MNSNGGDDEGEERDTLPPGVLSARALEQEAETQRQEAAERERDLRRLWWHVVVYYLEPTFAASTGAPAAEYRGGFDVRALDEAEAIARATGLFRAAAAESGVSWARVIERCTAERIDAPG